MRVFLIILIFTSTIFARPEKLTMMNSIKELIQKEEYIALAVNKYIIQTGKIPKDSNDNLDWALLSTSDYLGTNFNKNNPYTRSDFIAKFNSSNNLFIYGLGKLNNESEYNNKHRYLYNFYTNRSFRVNMQAPSTHAYTEVKKGSQIIYGLVQKEIIQIINDNNKEISLHSAQCPSNNYYYELKNGSITYKYCKSDHSSLEIYQKEPIYLEDWNDLKYVKASIGSKAYANKNGNWYEYYFQGDVSAPWVPVTEGSDIIGDDEEADIEDRIISYIPNSKDLVLRNTGGCMLANGDIFCWGVNTNKKAGIETHGQLSSTLSPDYVNTPVMLRVQIDNKTKIKDDSNNEYSRRDKKWYNNPYRVKFEKMAFNRTNVCGISPIFDYFQGGLYKKFGGDIYCNGKLSSQHFEDISDSLTPIEVTTSILKRNKNFAQFKDDEVDNDNQNEVYLKDVAMVDDTIAVLSDTGKIYTYGSNDKGALGINNTDEAFTSKTGTIINNNNQNFKKLYALRDTKCFGAIDSNNNFWIWGERVGFDPLYEPTLVSSGKFDSNFVLVNSKDFILKSSDKYFYRTYLQNDILKLSSIPQTALSVSLYDDGSSTYYLYVDENRQLQGESSLKNCQKVNDSNCSSSDNTVFNTAFNKLNTKDLEVNGKKYASFSNVSIFGARPIYTYIDFEKDEHKDGWVHTIDTTSSNAFLTTGNSTTGKYLGNFGGKKKKINLKKIFDFGTFNANKRITVTFDFYEIDSWDWNNAISYPRDSFQFKLNDTSKVTAYFTSLNSHADGGGFIGELGTDAVPGDSTKEERYFGRDEKHTFSYDGELDSNGQIKLEFIVNLDQVIDDESWGIDNIEIKSQNEESKKFVCAMTGLGSKSQMYCWGKVGRSLPILSTSLYDVSKISHINKLFITQESESSTNIAFDEFNNNGKLFLKYPTYLGGFDYEFYFK